MMCLGSTIRSPRAQSYGGTAPAQVRRQIALWKEKLG